MKKTVLITGATDGIGRETARMLLADGHQVLLHGRSPSKMERVKAEFLSQQDGADIEAYLADLSSLDEVECLAETVLANHGCLDVLINNAGVYHVNDPVSKDGLDVRFVVNTISPYLLTKRLFTLLPANGRVINLSSAAQAPFDPSALETVSRLPDGMVYAQSKLAITMWSRHLASIMKNDAPVVVAVNPKSMLGTKMVKEAFGVGGADPGIGAKILCRAALSDEFADASGRYFDNDIGRFSSPHPDAMNARKNEAVFRVLEAVLSNWN